MRLLTLMDGVAVFLHMFKKISQISVRTYVLLGMISALGFVACSRFKNVGDDVVAVVNGFVIKKSDTQKMNRPLEDVINQELVFQSAKKEGYLEKDLSVRQIVAQQYVSTKFGGEKPSAQDLGAFYEQNKKTIDMVRVSQIVFPVKEGSQALVGKIVQDIKKSKTPQQVFESALAKYSQDKNAGLNHGDMGFFTYADKPDAISQAVFSMNQVGEVAQAELEGNHHIFLMTGVRKGFDVNRALVQSQFRQKASQSKQQEWIAELKKKAEVKVYSPK